MKSIGSSSKQSTCETKRTHKTNKAKQIPENKFGKEIVLNNSCNEWNNLNVKLRKVKAKQKYKFELENCLIEIHQKIAIDRSITSFRDYFYI